MANGYHNEQKERQAIEQLIRHRCAALVVHAKMIPDADLASLMKQMPGMVLIKPYPAWLLKTVDIALDDRYGALAGNASFKFSKVIPALVICALTTLFLTPKIVCKGITMPLLKVVFRPMIGW
ncbi:galactose operon repressor [Escherichia coli]|uniref:Galactose operon repressor n=1 Tax=Escherichia coli TaxID=562 RepID=A0A376LAG6_ECOLX|nr:galactose operon repressor [Escherichia coli]